MQEFKRVLVKVSVDKLQSGLSINSFGAKPKYCTGYKYGSVPFYIPLKSLLEQGFNFPDKSPEWYEQGSALIDNIPCYMFWPSEVEVLAES
ncbi:hypothetical protein AVV30_gp027 [Vibrio phage phi 1]|uniref:Uncharacterized protein n=1 Tax=Vibrio phage phi 1 TaxID=1589297 RepID=A0A0B5HDX0_9CAUD|nr:hypothetical protein AVV30_gp027 [Vibrio phage phi 1]AJF40685.1 hypothetical protein SBVP1_0027 [Vibrio phage phi 1]